MRDLSTLSPLYRDYDLEREVGWPPYLHKIGGCFYFPLGNDFIQVIASNQAGWEHVSLSREERCPSFKDMVDIKEMFFNPGEIVIQVHPKKENYVNHNPDTLHLWRPTDTNVPFPNITAVLNKYEIFSSKRICKEGQIDGIRYVAIYDPNWADWDSVCAIKQQYFGDTEVIQYHVSKEKDLNDRNLIILWEYKNNFRLPPKELVY